MHILPSHLAQSISLPTLLVVAILIGSAGCSSEKKSADSTTGTSESDPQTEKATKIWRQTVSKYSNAPTYQDEAVLNLHYRLAGKWIEEFHPQSVTFDRQHGLAAKIFHARFTADNERATCFVYDLPTGNLDDQVWLNPLEGSTPSGKKLADRIAQSFGKLLADPIACHFLSGESEIPVQTNSESPSPSLFPLPISLLLQGDSFSNWNDSIRCSMDENENDNPSHHVIFVNTSQGKHKIWIDRKTGLVSTIQYDPKVLDPVLQNSAEVSDLKLVVEFKNATISKEISPQSFSTKLAEQAKPVTQFVKLPEAFPSQWIGHDLPAFDLHANGRARIASNLMAGQTNAILFVQADYLENETIDSYLKMADEMRGPKTRIAMVISGEPILSKKIAGDCERRCRNISVYFDPYMKILKKLKVSQTPAILITDHQMKTQYYKTLGRDPWQSEIRTAIRRVTSGESVADEMRAEYQQFLENYHANIKRANPFQGNTGSSVPVQNVSNAKESSAFKLELAWEANIHQPGRCQLSTSAEHGFVDVLDGYRKIVRIDSKGSKIKEWNLELPTGVAVESILRYSSSQKRAWNTAYSPGGQQVFVFDESWQPLFAYPSKPDPRNSIRGAVLCDLDRDRVPELYVLWNGINQLHRVDVESGNRFAMAQFKQVDSLTLLNSKARPMQLLVGQSASLATLMNADLEIIKQLPDRLGLVHLAASHGDRQSSSLICFDSASIYLSQLSDDAKNVAIRKIGSVRNLQDHVKIINLPSERNLNLDSLIALKSGRLMLIPSDREAGIESLTLGHPIEDSVFDDENNLIIISGSGKLRAYKLNKRK